MFYMSKGFHGTVFNRKKNKIKHEAYMICTKLL